MDPETRATGGGPPRPRNDVETVLAYHERTKHHPHGYARSLGYLDWKNQPDPFRRFEGSELLFLDEVLPSAEPSYDSLFTDPARKPSPVNRSSISQFFYDSLALSAWKEMGSARWSLRVNPSSGDLHPTEGYWIAGSIPGLSASPARYHYSPFHHGLERVASLPARDWSELIGDLPPQAMLVGLATIHWRESWKYGERAYRYCHMDVGHALSALVLSAAILGWDACLLEGWTDGEIATLLGITDPRGAEAEAPDCLLVIDPSGEALASGRCRDLRPGRALLARLSGIPRSGEPNQLSAAQHPWPIIDEVAAASARETPPPDGYWDRHDEREIPGPAAARGLSARQLVRQRRSAVAMDGRTGLSRDSFYGMLERVLPGAGNLVFRAFPWKPAIHLVLFVHRVSGLDPGLYIVVRDPGSLPDLRAGMRPGFEWSRPPECPDGLALYRLAQGDVREAAREVSCHQDIAADGAFALAMIAEFEPELREFGAWFYKRLHWEAGAIGQVLYLEAEAAGIRATGIGCFFDDALHEIVGLKGRRYQDVYHFTVGGAVDDPRLRTAPPYAHRGEPLTPARTPGPETSRSP